MTAAHRSLLLMAAIGVTAFGGTAVAAYFRISPAGMIAFIAVIMVGLFIAMAQWWRAVDEAVREAHKSAWFWGATAGLLPLIPLLIYLSHNQHMLDRFMDGGPYRLFGYGVMLTLIFELAGYGVAWAFWWARRR